MTEYYKLLEKTLKKDLRLWSDDETPLLLESELISLITKDDDNLLGLLLSDKEIESHFFKKVGKVTIFEKEKFIQFVTMNEFLPSSFTKFENKIGLSNNGKLLSSNDDVSLIFPHKDCILEGGQTKEEQKRDEIFFNTILAPDEVDRLREPKVFTNSKRISKDGEEVITEIKDSDNMIIKGNNLMALYSLLPKYRGKVKLIYIDPPYNTRSDSFGYNDSFNHSSWLTFMKNRLEIAKDLLRDDGFIFVQSDDNEQAYLKVLMDEVFNFNFINTITVKTKIGGVSGSSEGKSLRDATEFVNFYAKNKDVAYLNNVFNYIPLFEHISSYVENGKSWKYTSIITKLSGKKILKEVGNYKFYTYDEFETESVKSYAAQNNISMEDVYNRYSNKIFRTTNAQSSVRQTVIRESVGTSNIIVSIEYKPIKGKNKDTLVEILYKDDERNMVMFLSDIVEKINENFYYKVKPSTLWDDIQYNNLSKEGSVDFPNGKKPETLVQRIIELSSNKNDIVLDYHLGSGTTAAVAHKMGRQYIGIEQLNYGDNDSVVRLNNVINGDDSGISKAVDWKGGGEFVYTELLEWNQKYIDLLEKAKTKKAVLEVKSRIEDEAFYKYQIDLTKFDNKEFKDLSLDEQKMVLIDILDLNHLYVNINSMNDTTFKVSDTDKILNSKFYNLKD